MLFSEDEVFMVNKNEFKCGTVTESYLDSMYSDDEDLSYESSDLKKGSVRVTWYPSGQEKVVNESMLSLIERSLMPGDIVRKLDDPEGQKGYVIDCEVCSYLQVKLSNQVIASVSSKLLEELFPYGFEAVYVELDGWIGRTHAKQHYKATVECSDGARCILTQKELDNFDDVFDLALQKKRGSEFEAQTHYKGQKLKGTLADLKKAEWINPTKQYSAKTAKDYKKNRKQIEICVIEKVEVTKVNVEWLSNCSTASGMSNPGRSVTGEQLKRLRLLDPFVHATSQLGDSFYYTIQPGDQIETFVSSEHKYPVSQYFLSRIFKGETSSTLLTQNGQSCSEILAEGGSISLKTEGNGAAAEPMQEGNEAEDGDCEWEDVEETSEQQAKTTITRSNRKKRKGKSIRAFENLDLKPGITVPVEVVLSETFAEIMWQDGSISKNVSSRELCAAHHLDDNEFFPGDYVLRADANSADSEEYGVIVSVDYAQRIATVRWMFSSHSHEIPMCTIQSAEISVYELKDHPVYNFRPGAAVLRINYDERESLQCCEDDVIGSVLTLHCDGTMSIKWADGCISQCYPEQILLVANIHESSDEESSTSDDENGSSSEEGDSDSNDDNLSDSGSSSPALSALDWNGKQEFAKNIGKLLDKMEWVVKDVVSLTPKSSAVAEKLIDFMVFTGKFYKQYTCAFPSNNSNDLEECYRLSQDYQMFLQAHVDILPKTNALMEGMVDQQPSISNDVNEAVENLHTDMVENYIECPIVDEYLRLVEDLVSSIIKGLDLKKKLELSSSGDGESIAAQVENNKSRLTEFTMKNYADCAELCRRYLQHLLEACCEDAQNICIGLAMADKTESMEVNASGNYARVKLEQKDENSDVNVEHFEAKYECFEVKDEQLMSLKAETGILAESGNVCERFKMLTTCPPCHKYQKHQSGQINEKFTKAIQKELNLLACNLPEGIMVRAYEDRLDLLSAMITGPSETPYEDALFIFDILLNAQGYPTKPPTLYYHSYCSDRLNPNLYEEGKVCVSLLGTWSGKNTEVWNPTTSNLFQVLVSIQGLILNKEPYFNEAGYEKQRGSASAYDNSKKYNEMVLIKVLQSISTMLGRPHTAFQQEIYEHWKTSAQRFIQRIKMFMKSSQLSNDGKSVSSDKPESAENNEPLLPDFPLLPLSRGCTLTLEKLLERFQECLKSYQILCAKTEAAE